VFALLIMVAAACSGTPTAPAMNTPAGTIDVAGDWSGTWTYGSAGVTVTDEVTVRLNQSGATVSGTWTAQSGATGQINFAATASFVGSLTINQAVLGRSSCNASTSISGSGSTSQLDITLADITPQGVCQWGTGNRIVLTR
jgi:hypothetical protein